MVSMLTSVDLCATQEKKFISAYSEYFWVQFLHVAPLPEFNYVNNVSNVTRRDVPMKSQ